MRRNRVRRYCGGLMMSLLLSGGVARADLVGWWTFDDVSGEVVPDSSPAQNNGVLIDGATTSDDIPSFLKTGRSLLLAGGTQHVLVPDSDTLDIDNSMTIAAWVKPVGNIGWDAILAKSPSDDSQSNHAGNYELRIENGTRGLTFLHQQGGTNDTIGYGGGPMFPDSEWSHLAVTVSSEGVAYYRNGLLQSSSPLGGSQFFGATNDNPLYIGSRADLFTTMDGLLDDVRIYSEVLSAGAIRTLAGADAPPPPPADLLTATIHSVSSELATNFRRGAENLVNGSGLNPDGSHAILPDGSMWLNAGNGCCGDAADDLAPAAEVVFDLGSLVSLDRMKIWNYNENLPNRSELLLRGASAADVFTAGDDLQFTKLLSVNLDSGPGDDLTPFGQVVSLSGTSARYVKLSLPGNLGGDNDFVGLSEVQFFKTLANAAGDFNGDGVLDTQDIDQLTQVVIAATNEAKFDLNADGQVNASDRSVWVSNLKRTWFGDSNLDGEFNTGDLVQIFQRGEYEDALTNNSGWGDGDWSGDGEFDSSDLIVAFQAGGFERGAVGATAAVPEPATGTLLILSSLALLRRREVRRSS